MEQPYALHLGDCLELLCSLPDNQVDSIVTDPPYGLSFMNSQWDGDVPPVAIWAECLRVLKPGGHLLAFAGTRTHHRMVTRIEDAGFEIRDMIAWVYGSGLPKSKNLDGDWQGWGAALKPALEPITVARKPLAGKVAANVLIHGTGALNIDACRIPAEPMPPNTGTGAMPRRRENEHRGPGIVAQPHPSGRWPANLIHDGSPEVTALLPAEAGAAAPVHLRKGDKFRNSYGAFAGNLDEAGSTFYVDTGNADRFFYCAKASRIDRNEGCQGMDRQPLHWSSGDANPGSFQAAGTDKTSPNHHPTVKPTELMAYLCRLVTPPGGVVLDPFMGSGSTGKAALREGFRFLGIEREPCYFAIAQARLRYEQHQFSLFNEQGEPAA
ncbi:site-specific DNA-methyltransferase [Pseudomonas protegens]|uniref:Methyltransferase n=1 Tax=Pseudomonas protegens TaxID=380021 RepID=A0A2T6GB55_9PSED|nr:site-specific DNA-methyltransferase [Pseudomonas protegens]PUA41382.1 site-specific DNA-methyltransferase [Pseudomonas protegens]